MELSVFNIEKSENESSKVRANPESLSGKVTLPELFNTEFMSKYTKFSSLNDLLDDCGFVLTSPEDFEQITNGSFDREISSRTEFSGWEEMRTKAVQNYIATKLNS